jgi:hypothetical protein
MLFFQIKRKEICLIKELTPMINQVDLMVALTLLRFSRCSLEAVVVASLAMSSFTSKWDEYIKINLDQKLM